LEHAVSFYNIKPPVYTGKQQEIVMRSNRSGAIQPPAMCVSQSRQLVGTRMIRFGSTLYNSVVPFLNMPCGLANGFLGLFMCRRAPFHPTRIQQMYVDI